MVESFSERDARLVRETLSGDDNAYKELMERYVKIAGSIAYSVVRDYHIAADVVQEAFTKVYHHLPRLRNPATFRKYLVGAVRSSALDCVRRQKTLRRGSAVTFSKYTEEPPEVPTKESANRTLLAGIERGEDYGQLLDLINSLPEHYREVFILKHVEKIKYREIAEILGLTMGAVEARLFRARRMLRSILGEQET